MNYGGKGKFTLPENHKPFMKVPAGGSSCANCLFLSECGKHCTNKHFIEWYGSSELPTPINEYCSDWYEPKNAAESKQPGGEITDEPHTNGGCDMKHGEKTYNLEGNEVIINKTSMQITDIYAVKGTPKQIASAINELGGGTKFDDGGEIEKITTNIKQNQMETVQPPAHEQLHEKIEKEVIKSHKLITDQILYYPKRDERWKITDLLVDKINIEYQPKYNYEKARPEFITYEELIRDFDNGEVTVEGFTADEKAELKKAILFTIKEQQYNDLMKEKQATDTELQTMQDEYQKLQVQKDEAESGRDSYKNKFTDVKMESIRSSMQNLKQKIDSKKVLTKKFSQKIAELEKKYPFRTKINALKKKAKSKGDGGSIYKEGGPVGTKKLCMGDIYKLEGEKPYYTIISYREEDDSYYSFRSDKNGNSDYAPNSAGNIIHSNSWLGKGPIKVGHTDLKSVIRNIQGECYQYFLSENRDIDTEMANLDARWKAFAKYAPEKLRKKYDEQEDQNAHYANAKMVSDWFNAHLEAGGEIYQKGGKVSDVEHFRYLDIQKVKNGLKISINEEGRTGVQDIKETHPDWNGETIMSELFDDIQGNSEYQYHHDLGEMGFGLTSADGITNGYYYDDDGKFTDKGHTDSHVYYNDNYAIRSALEVLLRDGEFTFIEAMAKGGPINMGWEKLRKGQKVRNKNTGKTEIATPEKFGSRSFTDTGFFHTIHTDWEVISEMKKGRPIKKGSFRSRAARAKKK